MAYLHCHNKECGFSQDDFYHKGYNPFTKIKSDIEWLWKPKWIKLDMDIVEDLIKYTKVPIYLRNIVAHEYKMFSWNWLILEIVKDIKIAYKMKYLTNTSWKKAVKENGGKWPPCPKCGQNELDID